MNYGIKCEKTVIIKTSALEFFQLQTMKSEKRKKEKLENLELKILYLSIFGLEFEKNIAVFEISILECALLQSLLQK